jgi:hypothetical protein
MKTFYSDVADVHGGAFANGFQSLQDLDTICTVSVTGGGQDFLCLFTHILYENIVVINKLIGFANVRKIRQGRAQRGRPKDNNLASVQRPRTAGPEAVK